MSLLLLSLPVDPKMSGFGRLARGFLALQIGAACWAASAGCGSKPTADDRARVAVADGIMSPSKGGIPQSGLRAVREFTHDFEVVSPGFAGTHAFTIENTGRSPWTLKKIHVDCACTATEMSATRILPEKTESITVGYASGTKSGNERRKVYVEFDEPEAPLMVLVLKARVRRLVTCEPEELLISAAPGHSQPTSSSFMVFNFGLEHWDSVAVNPLVEWMTASAQQIPVHVSPRQDGMPTQAFRVDISVKTESLPPGSHSGHIALERVGANAPEATARMLVQVKVQERLRAIPSGLFFGECRYGEAMTRALQVVLSSDAGSSGAPAVRVPVKLKGSVDLELERVSARVWRLTAQLVVPDNCRGIIDETVSLSFDGDDGRTLQIPLKAFVVE
jgi:hypothetical protein